MIADLAVFLFGVAAVVWVWISVVRTVVLPRPERVWLTATSFEAARRITLFLARRTNPERAHRLLAAFAPTVLILLPLLWSIGLVGAFTALYWASTDGSLAESFDLSFSSLTTLGFVAPPNRFSRTLASTEALMGLAIIALMISFLPTLYSTFSRREIAVGRLIIRAGSPPKPVEFITRLSAIDQLDHLGEQWEAWEDWFVELEETHTTFPALIYFRSSSPERSWLAAAEMALDTAAVVTAAGLVEGNGQSETMLRSGYLALRSIADFYRVEPESTDSAALSVQRSDLDKMLDDLAAAGLQFSTDRDTIWEAFAGWRVNYDKAIVGLRGMIVDSPSHWHNGSGNDR